MKINKGFKFRIIPNSDQINLIEQTFGCCRWAFNQALDFRKNEYKLNDHSVSYKETSALLTKIKQLDDYKWLNNVDSTALQSSLKNLDSAYKNFFRDKKNGFPRFKSKYNFVQSYISKNNSNSIRLLDEKYIQIPKLGSVRIKLHRNVPKDAKINNATISKHNKKYYVSLSCEYEIKDPKPKLNFNKSIGIDYSSKHFGISDEGRIFEIPHYFRIYEAKLSRENRKLSKMKLHSSNWAKQKTKVSKIQEKISNSRKDCLHKLSKQIVENYDYIFLEDLNLQNIAQSLRLGKSTNDNGFGMFREFLKYKSLEKGKVVQKVNKFFASSKLCSVCGYKKIDLTLKDRNWVCPECGTRHDRDVNAAKNIKKEGLRILQTAGTAGLASLSLEC